MRINARQEAYLAHQTATTQHPVLERLPCVFKPMTGNWEYSALQLGFVLQPVPELPDNVILPQPQAGNSQGRTRKLM